MKILGIDPGTRIVGFGLLECRKRYSVSPRDYRVKDAGVLKADPKLKALQRISVLHQAVYDLLNETNPDICVIESAFLGANPQSALKLGQARGAIISAFGRKSLPVAEITPTEVKKYVTGSGCSEKKNVADALFRLLNFDKGRLPYDVTDALAIAFSYPLSVKI